METGNRTWVIGTILLIVGVALGYFGGNYQGERAGAARVAPLLDIAFPPPAEVINSFSGTIEQIYGASITLKGLDPDDYLPHLDGSPRRTVTRTAQVSAVTIYTLIDYSRLDREGTPARTIFLLTELVPGDQITVRSSENIRNVETFDVSAVERIVY